MPQDFEALPIGTKYILQGRVVTMGPQGVIPRGSIYVDSGEIKAVRSRNEPVADGFENAPAINTGDTIYPGFIELHNHLSYNAMPLWDVPLKFTNNGQWKNHEDYRRLITKPSQVLGRTSGVVEALVRFAECKCLLGGTTTSQGITLSSAGGIRTMFQGLVRNVERPSDPELPGAGTKIANPPTGEAEEYLGKLEGHTCYLQHLSEGIDTTARNWFHRLRLENGEWAVNEAFCGIHSTALDAEDFRIISERGGTMVWSPLSNFLLYGKTADIHAAKEAEILMGIGCDWAPSGSKNLLGEIKTAWLASEEEGGVFTPEEIVAMATVNAAKILKWDHLLGSIEPGKRADLVCINGQQGDDFLRVINARETSVTLVMIDGYPRVGQRNLMKAFQLGTEEIRLGNSVRKLHLEQENAHPLVKNLTLTEATRRLEEAMENLPGLAKDLDAAGNQGFFSGSSDSSGAVWQVLTDFEEDDRALEEALGIASLPLADFVEPMELEKIAVAGDTEFLRKLVAARNLPEYLKKGIPALYGKSIAIPESAGFLRSSPEPVPSQLLHTQDLKSFLRISGELTLDDRKKIVDQALLLLEHHYVHLPFKKAMHAVDPVQKLRLLRHRLDRAEEDGFPSAEIEFHNEMTRIFNSLRDLHTAYRLPSPFKQKTAWLPFFIEPVHKRGEKKYIVSKVVAGAGPESFVEGAEVLHWNGTPIHTLVEQHSERQAGSNRAARYARGLNSLTIRPLVQGLPPEEEWVTLRYRGPDGEVHEWRQEWLVFEPGRSMTSLDPEELLTESTAFGMDALTDEVQEAKKVLFAGKVLMEERRLAHEGVSRAIANTEEGPATRLPTVFRAHPVTTEQGRYGYIRIFTFNVRDVGVFVDEFVRIAGQLPQEGLIIDVRGNGGGLIHAAEGLLQVLTPRRIEPETAQFINTPVNLRLCRAFGTPSDRLPGFSLGEWTDSMSKSVETGAVYSLGFPITTPELANNIGQKYYGPALLITDGLCYSATDIFAAGFQDHGIGPILGTDDNTGAGGANVWSHRLLVELMRMSAGTASHGLPYSRLPGGSDLRVAIRRTLRVRENAGAVVEDLGVVPDFLHRMTRDDVLHGNRDLIKEAARILSERESHAIRIIVQEAGEEPSGVLRVEAGSLDWINVLVNGRSRRSYDIEDGAASIPLSDITGGEAGQSLQIEIQGFKGERFAAAARKTI